MADNPQITAAWRFAIDLEQRRWDGGVRVVIQGSMRAPVRDGSVTLEAGWRADVFVNAKQRKPDFVLVAETPQQLFTDLAALVSGEIKP